MGLDSAAPSFDPKCSAHPQLWELCDREKCPSSTSRNSSPPLASTDGIGSLSVQSSCPPDSAAANFDDEILDSHPSDLEGLLAGGLLEDVFSDAPYLRALFNACFSSLVRGEADPILTESTAMGLGVGRAAGDIRG